jgi:hypothetical protein
MEQLKLLMDYTIFHIGVYITLSALMVSLLGLKAFEGRAQAMRCYLIAALVCFVLAGMFGGVVASNIPYFHTLPAFTTSWIGPWFATQALPAWFCMTAEHTAFWAGVSVFLFGFWRTR